MLFLALCPANAMEIAIDWTGTRQCLDPQSPLIRMSAVPGGTTKLRFRMVDLDFPSFNHGGGTISYKGQTTLPKGAFSYKGPCPREQHDYEWTVEALDASGKVLGSAKVVAPFP